MPRPLAALLICMLLATASDAPRSSRAQEVARQEVSKTHIFLFDVSGSMWERYGNDLKGWLIQPLLKNGAFGGGDRVIVRWFHQSQNAAFNPNDPLRKVRHEPFNEKLVLDNTPTADAPRGACTDIPGALDLVLSDIGGYKVTSDALIWIVTDNVQEACNKDQGKNITPFYNKIADRQGKEFRSAHLFPLGKERGASPPPGKGALILYLLHYSQEKPHLSLSNVSDIAKETAKKIDNPAITWLPFESAVIPGPEFTDNEEMEVVDGVVRLKTPIQEGDPLNLNFSFRLKSPKQRSISGKIKNERFQLDWPSFVSIDAGESAAPAGPPAEEGGASEVSTESSEVGGSAEGSGTGVAAPSWDVQISPDNVMLQPEGKTGGNPAASPEYTVVMSNPAALRPASFFSALTNSTSPPIPGRLLFDLADLQTEVQFDNPALNQVPNTDVIKTIVQKSTEKPRSIPITVEFQVQYNNAWRWLVLAIVALVLIGLLIGVVLLLTLRTRYILTTPSGERTLALPVVGKQFISVGGTNAAVVSKRFGTVTVAPIGSYTIGGEKITRRLTGNNDQFTIEDPNEGRSYPHAFRRANRAVNVAARKDTFLED